uniref:G protein-coupled receptor n=1 Tax=Panagrolaimus sp. PS1159 TaxID=55785 RepID=A0AC35FPF4_9BILA
MLLICSFPLNTKDYIKFEKYLNIDFWLNEHKNGISFTATSVTNPFLLSAIGYVAITTGFSYSMVIYFGIKIVKMLKSHVSRISNTKVLSRQIQKTLTIQAVGPLFIMILPIACFFVLFLFQINDFRATLFFSFFFGWISVVNPLAAITNISSYRQKIKEFFFEII